MRIWDIAPRRLCRAHLLGEHRELPETLRWKGKLRALYNRHDAQVAELKRRNYKHHSPLDRRLAKGRRVQDEWIDSPRRQRQLLRAKGCHCR